MASSCMTRCYLNFTRKLSNSIIQKSPYRYKRLIHMFCSRRNIVGFSTVSAISFFSKKEEKPVEAVNEVNEAEILISKADKLYTAHETLALYDLLIQYSDSGNDEILWRLARAATDKGKMSGQEDRKVLYYDAFGYVKKALEMNPDSAAAHKWYAILLDYTGELEGTKARIIKSYEVKEHFLKSIELNPKDATSIHSLGVWCFTFADMAWYQKKICNVVFATPPSSSYEEALTYFIKAEQVDPNFYSMNLLMLGKTYLRLGDKDQAIQYLIQAKNYPANHPDDQKANLESIELLKGLGIKTEG